MSRIYFRSLNLESEVRGSERAYFGVMISELALAILNPLWNSDRLKSILPPTSYLLSAKDDREFDRNFRTWFRVTSSEIFVVGDKKIEPFSCALNTALAIGNDVIKLAARIHGQCEIHCYVEGKNRNWLAKIIQQGLRSRIYRPKQGWEETVNLLRNTDKEPVVLSYSVCDQFPNPDVANFSSENDNEDWYGLSFEKQWELALLGLRKSKNGLEISPQHWNQFYFSEGISAFGIMHELYYVKELFPM